jgi:hypothetical protein
VAAQSGNMAKPALSQALAAEQANLDLGLVEPASVLGRVVHSEALP